MGHHTRPKKRVGRRRRLLNCGIDGGSDRRRRFLRSSDLCTASSLFVSYTSNTGISSSSFPSSSCSRCGAQPDLGFSREIMWTWGEGEGGKGDRDKGLPEERERGAPVRSGGREEAGDVRQHPF